MGRYKICLLFEKGVSSVNRQNFYKLLYKNNDIIELRFIGKNKNPQVHFVKVNNGFIKCIDTLIEKYNKDYNCYFGVNPRLGESKTKVDKIRACFVDIDSKDFQNEEEYNNHIEKLLTNLKILNLYPTAIVNSGHGKHLYWKLKNALNVEQQINKETGEVLETQKQNTWKELQEALIYYCKADRTIKDLPRILRVPESYNIKDKPIRSSIENINEDNEYSITDFKPVQDYYKTYINKQREEQKAKKHYEKNYKNDEAFKKAVIDTLENKCRIIDNYHDWIGIMAAYKNEGYSYDDVDRVLRNNPKYTPEKNRYHFDKLQPRSGGATFAKLYYIANKSDPAYLRNKIKEYKGESDKKDKISKKEKDNKQYEGLIEATEHNIIREFLKDFTLININPEKDPRQIKNTYFVYKRRRKLLQLYDNSKYNPLFKDIMESKFLSKFCVTHLTQKGETKKKYKFNDFWTFFSTMVMEDDSRLEIKDVDISNAPTLLHGDITYKTNLDEDLIITEDYENLIYKDLSARYHPEVEDIFEKLFGNNNKLIQADIISTIINENTGLKHFTVFTASPRMGKSKTAELIIRICNDGFTSSLDINEVDKMWESFFATRTPFFDNVDVAKDFDSTKANALAGIITAPSKNMNTRYSKTGKLFKCDVYPKLTTTDEFILSRKDFTALKSRTIQIHQERNAYAKKHIDDFYDNKKFIKAAREHFFWKVKKYLYEKQRGNINLPTKIDHRAKNFFKALWWLDQTVCENFYRDMSEITDYNEVTNEFLKFLRTVYFTGKSSNTEVIMSASEWVDNFKNWTDKTSIKESDKITNQTLFRNNIYKFAVSETLEEFKLIKKTMKGKRLIGFTTQSDAEDEYDVEDELMRSRFTVIDKPAEEDKRKEQIQKLQDAWQEAVLDSDENRYKVLERILERKFTSDECDNWYNFIKPRILRAIEEYK